MGALVAGLNAPPAPFVPERHHFRPGYALPRKTSPMSIMPTFSMRGAFTEVDDDATAFGGPRRESILINIDSLATEPEPFAADRAWVREFWGVRTARPDQGGLRPAERVPPQREHPAREVSQSAMPVR